MAVLVPRTLWEEASPDVRSGILKHELTHWRNSDLYVSMCARLLVLVH
jgi:Zn-dependent protease with chaperone function